MISCSQHLIAAGFTSFTTLYITKVIGKAFSPRAV